MEDNYKLSEFDLIDADLDERVNDDTVDLSKVVKKIKNIDEDTKDITSMIEEIKDEYN